MNPQKFPEEENKSQWPEKQDKLGSSIDPTPSDGGIDDDLSLADEKNTSQVTAIHGDHPQPPRQPQYGPSPLTPPSTMPASDFFAPDSDHPLAPVQPKRRKLKLFAIIAGVIVVLLGASAAAYFTYYLPNQPENVLKTALVNSFSKDKISSAHFKGEINVKDTQNDALSVAFEGASNQEGAATFTANIDALVTTVTVDARTVDGKTFYAKVGGLEGLPELLSASGNEQSAAYAPLLAALDEQWYEINESLLQQMFGGALDTGLLTDEDRQKIAKAYEQHQFLKIQETLPDEKIDGTDSHHYKVAIDNTKLKDFMSAIKSANVSFFKLSEEMVKSFNDAINDTDFSKYPVEVWIAKDSKLFTQFKFTVQEDDATMDLTLTITDYNKPVEVEKPEGAKSILEVLGTLFEAAQGLPQQSVIEGLEDIETNGDVGEVTL